MSVKVEKTENKNELKLEFTVEAKVFDEGIKKVFNKNARYFNIPGFRKGRAPMNIVEKYYGDEIFYEDAFNEVVPAIYDEAIKNEKLEVVSRPKIDIVQMEKGKDLIFTAIVDVKPEVKLGKYKGISIEKTEYKVEETDIDAEIKTMAERNSRMVTVSDRAAKKGDIAVIDFVGSVNGVEFEGGKASNHELELGSNTFIPGFEDQVIGMKTEEVKDVKVKFPEEYFSKELAGKDAVFKVTLHEIKEKELPKIDDEFAKDVSEFDTLKELKADIKSKKEKQNEERSKAELEEKAVKAVAADSTIDIPSGMIELEIDNMEQDMDRRLSYQGINLEQYLQMLGKTKVDFRNESQEPAKQNIQIRLVLDAVFNDAKLEISDKEVDEKIKELATTYGRKEEDLRNNEELLGHIKDSIKSEKAIAYIVDNAKVKVIEEKKEKEEKTEKVEKKSTTKKTSKKTEADKEAKSEKETKTEKKPAKKSTKKAE
ncbi:MAG TPA: trigger factor [Candidatus Scatovivens faecipullorum]|nr:trigger factor [Candidatus Scatovivens faecipullorum]